AASHSLSWPARPPRCRPASRSVTRRLNGPCTSRCASPHSARTDWSEVMTRSWLERAGFEKHRLMSCRHTPEKTDRRTQGVTMTGSSTQGIKIVLHPVTDLARAKPVYAALLGVEPMADSPYYVGFEAEGQQIGLVPGGGGMTSPVPYWHVADIEAKLAEVTAAGAAVKDSPRDVGGGRLVATFTDPDGNVLGVLQDR